MNAVLACILAVIVYSLFHFVLKCIQESRLAYIQTYPFHRELARKFSQHYPHLSKPELEQVQNGLRVYFKLRLKHGQAIAMPSRAVDVLWHEFIVFTQDYQAFCHKAFGEFLHHRPFSSMQSPTDVQFAMDNVWRHSCERENINPVIPQRLPLLFRLDSELRIPDSFAYSIEQGVYPKLRSYISPDALSQGIAERYRQAQANRRWPAEIEQLATILKQYLLDDTYCKNQGGTALTPLADSLLAKEDLAAAIFGNKELARKRLQEAKKLPDPASCA